MIVGFYHLYREDSTASIEALYKRFYGDLGRSLLLFSALGLSWFLADRATQVMGS